MRQAASAFNGISSVLMTACTQMMRLYFELQILAKEARVKVIAKICVTKAQVLAERGKMPPSDVNNTAPEQ